MQDNQFLYQVLMSLLLLLLLCCSFRWYSDALASVDDDSMLAPVMHTIF